MGILEPENTGVFYYPHRRRDAYLRPYPNHFIAVGTHICVHCPIINAGIIRETGRGRKYASLQWHRGMGSGRKYASFAHSVSHRKFKKTYYQLIVTIFCLILIFLCLVFF